MDTIVQYHDGTAAIDVKIHVAGYDFWPPEWFAIPSIGPKSKDDIVDSAYEVIRQVFWDNVESIAAPVLGTVYQDGRSGGWLVFDNDPTDGGYVVPSTEWLAEYRELVEWCETFIADGPRMVRDLAVQLAMDELGRGPARRMFGDRS